MVHVNTEDAIRRMTANFAQLGRREVSMAVSAAINRSLTHGRAQAGKQIKAKYNIKQSVLDGAFAIKKSTTALLVGDIKASTKAISLVHFQPTFSFSPKSITKISKSGVGVTRILKNRSKAYGKGVTVEIVKGRKVAIPYAFMIAGKKPVFARGKYESGGKYGFIQRHKRVSSTGSDTPITSLVNVSIYSSLVNNKVMPEVNVKLSAHFEMRLLHELNFRLSRMR